MAGYLLALGSHVLACGTFAAYQESHDPVALPTPAHLALVFQQISHGVHHQGSPRLAAS